MLTLRRGELERVVALCRAAGERELVEVLESSAPATPSAR
jgi:hypothetical protein